MAISLDDNRVTRLTEVEHWVPVDCAPPAEGDSTSERLTGVAGGDVALPSSFDLRVAAWPMRAARESICLHASGDPAGFFEDLVHLTLGEQVDRAAQIKVAVP